MSDDSSYQRQTNTESRLAAQHLLILAQIRWIQNRQISKRRPLRMRQLETVEYEVDTGTMIPTGKAQTVELRDCSNVTWEGMRDRTRAVRATESQHDNKSEMHPRVWPRRSATTIKQDAIHQKCRRRSATVSVPLPYLEKQFRDLDLYTVEEVLHPSETSFGGRDPRNSSMETTSQSEVDDGAQLISERQLTHMRDDLNPSNPQAIPAERQSTQEAQEAQGPYIGEQECVIIDDVEIVELNNENKSTKGNSAPVKEKAPLEIASSDFNRNKPNKSSEKGRNHYTNISTGGAVSADTFTRVARGLLSSSLEQGVCSSVKIFTDGEFEQMPRQEVETRMQLCQEIQQPVTLTALDNSTNANSTAFQTHVCDHEDIAITNLKPALIENEAFSKDVLCRAGTASIHRPLRELINKTNKTCYQVDSNKVRYKAGLSKNSSLRVPHLHAKFDREK